MASELVTLLVLLRGSIILHALIWFVGGQRWPTLVQILYMAMHLPSTGATLFPNLGSGHVLLNVA